MGALPYKFPRTPHLHGSGATRDDRVLSAEETRRVLSLPLRVDEKVDGANLGIHFEAGEDAPSVQNRGHVLGRGEHAQYAPLWGWLTERQDRLRKHLGHKYVLYGEWLYARHSVRYERLPSYFLAFDLLDKSTGKFLDRETLRRVCDRCDVDVVYSAAVDHVFRTVQAVASAVGISRFSHSERAEGLYLRHEEAGFLVGRYKWVRPNFTAGITEHWATRPIEKNGLLL